RIEIIDPCKQVERVARRQVIPQLRSLTEYGTDMKRQLRSVFPWRETKNSRVAARRSQDACQHANGRRFTGTIRSNERNRLTFRHGKTNRVNRNDFRFFTREKTTTLVHFVYLAQILYFNCQRHKYHHICLDKELSAKFVSDKLPRQNVYTDKKNEL